MAVANLKLFFNSSGNIKKNINEGSTAQKMLVDKSIIFWIFLVSIYNQIMAIMEIRGSDASIAAMGANFLASSDTPAMINADHNYSYDKLHVLLL